MNLSTIKSRMDRKLLLLIAVFAIALSGTGIASLATLQQNLNLTVVGTATTIAFKINDSTPTFAVDFGLVERGDVRFLPINLSNTAGTGYVSVSTSAASPGGGTSPYFTLNGADITTSTKMVAYADTPAADCNAASAGVPNWATAPTIATAPIFGGSGFTIPAGGFKDICLVFQVGGDSSLGPVAAGGTNLDLLWQIKGYYP